MGKVKLKAVPNFEKQLVVAEAEREKEMTELQERLEALESGAAEEAEKYEVAAEAAEYIAGVITEKTWTQGQLDDGNGAFCAMGHIERVDQGLEGTLRDALTATATKGRTVECWNDANRRTWQQVKNGFLQAAKWLRKQAAAA